MAGRVGVLVRPFVAVLVAGLLLAVAAPALGSEPEERSTEPDSITATGRTVMFDFRDGNVSGSPGFLASAATNRVYAPTASVGESFRFLSSFDPDTGALLAEAELYPESSGLTLSCRPGIAHSGEGGGDGGVPNAMTLDDAGGRLFAAMSCPLLQRADTTHQGACVLTGCVSAAAAFDRDTLEPLGRADFRLSVDGIPVSASAAAISWSPPRGADDRGKVLLLLTTQTDTTAKGSGLNPQSFNAHPWYAVQADPLAGAVDWVVRVDACRSRRAAQEYQRDLQIIPPPNHGAIYRSASLENPMVVVGCINSGGFTGNVVRIPLDEAGGAAGLPVRVGDPASGLAEFVDQPSAESSSGVASMAASPQTVSGPDRTIQIVADPAGERMLFRVVDAGAEVWWVYDNVAGQFLGTIGIGALRHGTLNAATSGFDATTGRLYVYATDKGLFVADTRRSPIAQALHFPEFAAQIGHPGGTRPDFRTMVVQPAASDRSHPTRVFVPLDMAAKPRPYAILEDRLPMDAAPPRDEAFADRTLDLEEREGVTAAAFDGTARGYGARFLLLGGLDAATRVGPLDPMGQAYQCNTETSFVHSGSRGPCSSQGVLPEPYEPSLGHLTSPCTEANREVILGFAGPRGPAVVDASGSRGGAEPVVFDSTTRGDADAPASRCTGKDWQQLWATGLFGSAPMDEPAAPLPELRTAQCTSDQDDRPQQEHTGSSDSVGDAVSGNMAARVECEDGEAGGFAYTRGQSVGTHSVAEAISTFRIYRDPGRGIVARVESVARGVALDGIVRIDTVRGTAESWANGRNFAPPEGDDTYEPNCDYERTAGTCFTGHVFGVRTPAWSCGPCGDEAVMADRISRALGGNGSVRLREPDPILAKGADNGFIAAVVKPQQERFADLALNGDLLQTMLPVMEIIRQAPPNRTITGGGPRGRQIIQLAGVEVSTSYGISCRLVYDESANTCTAPSEPPGSIRLALHDTDGEALAGGAFEIRHDTDNDGLAGLLDTLVPDGACATGPDGTGTCAFDDLTPGAYLATQTAAPPGYTAITEPFPIALASGEQRTVTFVNAADVSDIELTVTGHDGEPLAGAAFAVYADPDSDGKIAAEAQPAATCTTNVSGTCTMRVPSGSYVLVQTSAPGGLEPIEPVAFTFATGGQTAAITVANVPPDTPTAAGPQPPAVTYDPGATTRPTETITSHLAPPENARQPQTAPSVDVTARMGGTITRIIRAPGDTLRLLARQPVQAVAWTAALSLYCLAALAIQRRHSLQTLYANAGAVLPRTATPGDRGPSSGRRHTSGPGPGTAARRRVTPPIVAGAAPAMTEGPTISVIAASSSAALTAIIANRLEVSERCRLETMARDIEQLRAALAGTVPDVLVVDLTLPTGGPQDICDVLTGLFPAERTVGLIPPGRSREALVNRGFSTGLRGLLIAHDDVGNGHLAYAISCVAAGRPCFGPTVQDMLLQRRAELSSPAKPRLTPRELQIAQLAAQGTGRKEIAESLYLSPWTVKRHLVGIRSKLGVTNPYDRQQLRFRLEELGLLDDSAGE